MGILGSMGKSGLGRNKHTSCWSQTASYLRWDWGHCAALFIGRRNISRPGGRKLLAVSYLQPQRLWCNQRLSNAWCLTVQATSFLVLPSSEKGGPDTESWQQDMQRCVERDLMHHWHLCIKTSLQPSTISMS